jgi:hypothetical protein
MDSIMLSAEVLQTSSFLAGRNPQPLPALVMIADSFLRARTRVIRHCESILALDLRLSLIVFSNETKSTKVGWSSSSPRSLCK